MLLEATSTNLYKHLRRSRDVESGVPSCEAAGLVDVGPTEFLRPCGRPSDSLSSLLFYLGSFYADCPHKRII